jgi:hypothetical protein
MLILTLTFSVFIDLVHADELTVSTNQFSYNLGATINVYGKLTLGGNPVKDGLVAVQVEDSQGITKVVRVVNTGTSPSPYKVQITKFIACDFQGSPKNTFYRGSPAYFYLEIERLDADSTKPRNVIIALNIFDSVGFSIGIHWTSKGLNPKEKSFVLTSIPIPDYAFAGEATCTLSILTDWPKNKGYPYCPEETVKFKILEGQGPSTPQQLSTSSNGNFNIYFKLPNNARLGDYSIYANSRFSDPAYATFDYVWRLTDIDRNGKVDIADIFILAKAYPSKPGDPKWNPKADVNKDGKIDINDVFQMAQDFRKARRV